MLTFYVDEKTPAGKSLLQYALQLKAPSKSIQIRKSKRVLTDEEMALPGAAPTAEELEKWLIAPDKDKGSDAEAVRERLVKKFHKEFSGNK